MRLHPGIALLIFLALVTIVLVSERRRRAREQIPGGLAGLKEDFRRARGDRVAILLLGTAWLASIILNTWGHEWRLFSKYAYITVELSVIAYFALKRKEFERVQTYRASFVAFSAVVSALVVSSFLRDADVILEPWRPEAILSIAIWTFLLSYLLLKKRAT
jgi:hypothetical protein